MTAQLSRADYLAEAYAPHELARRERQAAPPLIGIFWFILNTENQPAIMSDASTLREADDRDGLKLPPRDYDTMWRALRPHLGPHAVDVDADTWPRGRISYDPTVCRFRVVCDAQLFHAPFHDLILSTFNLSTAQTDFLIDPDCQSSRQLPPST